MWNPKLTLALFLILHNSIMVHCSVLPSEYKTSQLARKISTNPEVIINENLLDAEEVLRPRRHITSQHDDDYGDEYYEFDDDDFESEEAKENNTGRLFYPGTKWCGSGKRAADYNDLGVNVKEDMCCRDHDHCTDVLLAGECKQGICNEFRTTRSHCDCDLKFRQCLQNIDTVTANTIGAVFFNIVKIQCYKEGASCDGLSLSSCSNEFVDQDLYTSRSFRPSRSKVARVVQVGKLFAKDFARSMFKRFTRKHTKKSAK